MSRAAQDAELVKQIHSSAAEWMALAVTGGGSSAVSQLLSVAGASQRILDAILPYHPEALRTLLGVAVESACSARTARLLAMAAYQRARRLKPEEPVLGLGATAALATNRPRRGQDRCFIAIQTYDATREISIALDKSLGRQRQEALCAQAILQQLALAAGLAVPEAPDYPRRIQQAEAGWAGMLDGSRMSGVTDAQQPVKALFPGSFNPFHDGHAGMARLAERRLGCQAHLEISVLNVDKPPLDYLEMADRRAAAGLPLIYTNAPTFAEKARLFPGAVFVVGVDTLSRIDEARYYGGGFTTQEELSLINSIYLQNPDRQGLAAILERIGALREAPDYATRARDSAIREMAALGNRFLVFGRRSEGRFVGLEDLAIKPDLAALCEAVPESDFRMDVSSSALRRNAQPGKP